MSHIIPVAKMSMIMESEFTGTRIITETLIPVRWKIKVDFIGNEEFDSDEVSIVYQKIKFWVDTLLDQSVMIDVNDDFGMSIADIISNRVMLLPDSASDDIIVQVIFEKLRAISENKLICTGIRLTGDDTNLTYQFVDIDGTTNLPGIEYFNAKAVHKEPWWKRSTSDTRDYCIDEEDAENIKSLSNTGNDILSQYEKRLKENFGSQYNNEAAVIDIFPLPCNDSQT